MDNRLDVPIEIARRNVEKLGIRYDELPQRPFWSPLFGNTEEDFRIRVAAKVMAGSVLTGRELSQPERDALAQHYAKLLATQMYAMPIAIGASLGFYRYTYRSYGFPFWKPNPEKFNPNKFGPLPEGYVSQRAWHGLRLLTWYAGCRVISALFLTSYSISVYMAGYGTDPRLQDYREDVKARSSQLQAGAMRKRGQLPPSGTVARTGAPPSSPWASTEQSTQDAQSSWPVAQTPQPQSPQAPFDDEPYVFDDASPVAASEQQRGTPQQSAERGSAWDRIRGQARGGAAAQGQGQMSAWNQRRQDELTSRGAQDGTSYSFSSGDKERSYAKEQAQQEFDEMLERERRGRGDGSSP